MRDRLNELGAIREFVADARRELEALYVLAIEGSFAADALRCYGRAAESLHCIEESARRLADAIEPEPPIRSSDSAGR